eukprot:scaffold616_cov146-Skeletonema_menzelii.AAC.11
MIHIAFLLRGIWHSPRQVKVGKMQYPNEALRSFDQRAIGSFSSWSVISQVQVGTHDILSPKNDDGKGFICSLVTLPGPWRSWKCPRPTGNDERPHGWSDGRSNGW